MASVPGIVSSALGQLPAREDWLSQATLSSPGAVVPKLTSLLSTKDATLVLLQYSLMRNAELTRVGGKLIDPSESVLANVQRYFVEVSPSVVKQYCVRVAQILAAQAVAEKNPSFGTMVCASELGVGRCPFLPLWAVARLLRARWQESTAAIAAASRRPARARRQPRPAQTAARSLRAFGRRRSPPVAALSPTAWTLLDACSSFPWPRAPCSTRPCGP